MKYLNFFGVLAALGAPVMAQESNNQGILDRLAAIEGILKRSIVASPEPCSTLGDGWEVFEGAEGRFLLGAGVDYPAGSIGGLAKVPLSENEMPRHVHGVRRQTDVSAQNDNAFLARGERSNISPADTTPAGAGEPHENMPPFVTIHFCKSKD